jgi:hypothetical protein
MCRCLITLWGGCCKYLEAGLKQCLHGDGISNSCCGGAHVLIFIAKVGPVFGRCVLLYASMQCC